jgi:hypothetical protein
MLGETPMANTCEIHVGRLMEIRVDDGYRSVRDVDRMIVMMQAHMSAMTPGQKYIIAADWRNVRMMAPETAARAREMLARSNPRVIRSAILSSPDRSLANLQVVRLIREAESTSRRNFINVDESYLWLAEVLTEAERVRLAEFLSLTRAVGDSEPSHGSHPRGLEAGEPRSGESRNGDSRSSEARGGESRGVDARSAEPQRAVDSPRSGRNSIWPSLLDPGRRTARPDGSDL